MTNRESALRVKGFEKKFTGYGFTETSLPTKLLATGNHYIVPVPYVGALHIEKESSILGIEREQKDALFQKRHNFYFNHYLNLKLKDVI